MSVSNRLDPDIVSLERLILGKDETDTSLVSCNWSNDNLSSRYPQYKIKYIQCREYKKVVPVDQCVIFSFLGNKVYNRSLNFVAAQGIYQQYFVI